MSCADLLFYPIIAWLLYKMLRWSEAWPYPKDRKSDFLDRAAQSVGDSVEESFRVIWRVFIANRDKKFEYTESNLKYWQSDHFMIYRTFTAQTLLGFKVEYDLELMTKRIDPEEFKKHRMLDEHSRNMLAEETNRESFLPYLDEHGYFFSFSVPSSIEPSNIHRSFGTTLFQLVKKRDGQTFVREYADGSFKAELHKITFRKMGCEVNLGVAYRLREGFSDYLIEENYAMLTNEQKTAILEDENFAPLEEMLAVAALKRRLDFLGYQSNQRHEADMFSVTTERAGDAVRISWDLKENAGYDLLGYRTTDGFHPNEYAGNGIRVIHSSRNGETIESLRGGPANFYTLFLRSHEKRPDGTHHNCSLLRFQLAVPSRKETEALEAAIKRLEQRKPVDPARENMAQALKKLGLAMEFQEALEAMEKTLIEQVIRKKLPKEEEEEQIEFIRDEVRIQRDEYREKY